MQEERFEDDPILREALSALRAAPVPDGPPLETALRTTSALRGRDAYALRISPAAAWMRIAALLLLGLGAVGIAVAIIHRNRTLAQLLLSTQHPAPSTQSSSPTPQSPDFAENPSNPSHLPGHQPPGPRPLPAMLVSLERKLPQSFAFAVQVTGHVYYDGQLPPHTRIDTSKCPDCQKAIKEPLYDESLIVHNDSTIQNVVVSISGGLPSGQQFSIPPDPVVIDQRNCRFEPHVVAAMIGQEVIVNNSDPILHSVRSMESEESPVLKLSQPVIGARLVKPFQTVQTMRVRCDIHPWMSAWIRTFNHPYFSVTRADGMFTINDLPPGTYTIKAWHEKLGVQEKQITVHGGEPTVLDFTFEPRD